MKVTKSHLIRLLSPGTEFEAQYCGQNTSADREKRKRKVLKQNNQEMISEILEGPKKGEVSYCSWTDVKVDKDDECYTLSIDDTIFVKFFAADKNDSNS